MQEVELHPLLLALADLAARYGMPIDLYMEAVPRDIPFPEHWRTPANTAIRVLAACRAQARRDQGAQGKGRRARRVRRTSLNRDKDNRG